MKFKILVPLILLIAVSWKSIPHKENDFPTVDDGTWYYQDRLPAVAHHIQHQEIFGREITGYNRLILKAIDLVQSTAMDGGTYFMGGTAIPPESPIGHVLKLFTRPLLSPPRHSSYCTGATYAAFIEAMNLIISPEERGQLSQDRFEALRMQELDGGRREDHVKFWGHWNADNTGHSYAMVQYSQMGKEISAKSARPGDFVNIIWKNNHGHAVIFLGWQMSEKGELDMLYWSSQPGTNGLGDSRTHVSNTKRLTFVRLVDPRKIFSFDVDTEVDY